jgi:hypothetical protein
MKKAITIALLFACFTTLHAQIRYLPKFVRKMYFSNDSSKHSSFVLLPVLASAPETGVEGGAAGLYSFYSDTSGQSTKVSNIFIYGTITTKGQNRLSLSTNYYSPQNKYHLTAAVSYINFPFDFYGIGNNTRLADADHIGENRELLKISAEKLLTKNLYVGVVLGGFNYTFSDANTTGIFNTSPAVQSRNGGGSVYIGPSMTFDSRDNNTYSTKGLILNAYLDVVQGVLSNNNYHGGILNVEYSQFFALLPKFVLGVDIQEQSLIGGQSPFYLLPQLGSDEMMRGYYGGRYRDRNLIAGQAELRFRASDRIGLVGFIGAGEVAHAAFSVSALKPDIGGGIRYFFDIEKGLSVRIDYGIGEKPTGEKRESGLYVGLGQAF